MRRHILSREDFFDHALHPGGIALDFDSFFGQYIYFHRYTFILIVFGRKLISPFGKGRLRGIFPSDIVRKTIIACMKNLPYIPPFSKGEGLL
jgi:hypothetical protein